jgi:hypothetical protein
MATTAEVFRVFFICYSKMQGQNLQTHDKCFIYPSSKSIVHNYPPIKHSKYSYFTWGGPRFKFQREGQLSKISSLTVFLRQMLI